jgi:regulator of protease activity HflC (stomatin/prohibitin superfamily)
VSDDLAQQSAPSNESPDAIPFDEPEPLPAAFVQLTEITATPQDAADAIERRDSLGRIPVVVRIRRQPPIKIEWIIIAAALGASGLLPPLDLAFRVLIFVLAIAAVAIGLVSRLFLRVPPGTAGLVVKGGRHDRVVAEGVHRVNPMVALSHLVSTREIAFDVPVSEVRSSDGVGVSVDLMLSLKVADPVKFAYSVSTGDADQLVHAAAQEAVRTLIRGIEAMSTLDLGDEQATILREVIDAKLSTYGISARNVSFTRVTLPAAFTSSLEARRLSVVQLAEQSEAYTLERRRLADHASLISQEAEARRNAVEHDAAAEALRLAKMEERLAANPHAAQYDMEMSRIRIAQQLAGNSRAVVSLGATDLVSSLLVARESADTGAAPAAPSEPGLPSAS